MLLFLDACNLDNTNWIPAVTGEGLAHRKHSTYCFPLWIPFSPWNIHLHFSSCAICHGHISVHFQSPSPVLYFVTFSLPRRLLLVHQLFLPEICYIASLLEFLSPVFLGWPMVTWTLCFPLLWFILLSCWSTDNFMTRSLVFAVIADHSMGLSILEAWIVQLWEIFLYYFC